MLIKILCIVAILLLAFPLWLAIWERLRHYRIRLVRIEPIHDETDETIFILHRSAYLVTLLESYCDRFLELHGYELDQYEGDELEMVIWSARSQAEADELYRHAMERIAKRYEEWQG